MVVCKCEAHEEFERLRTLVESLETENLKLNKKIEDNSKQEKEILSAREQEIYSLKCKQEVTEKCVQNYQEEVDALHADKIAFERTLLYGHKKALEDYQEQMNCLKSELELARSEVAEVVVLRGEVATAKKLSDDLRIQLQQQQQQLLYKEGDASVAVVDQEVVADLNEENEQLKTERDSWRDKEEKAQGQLKGLRVRLGDKDEEILQLSSDCKALCTEKERLQGESRVMKARLDACQAKPDHNRGNSLFSEVEDRRVEVEKKMIEMRLEIDSLKKRLKHSQDLLDDAKTHSLALWEGRALGDAGKRVAELEEDLFRMSNSLMQKALLMNKKEDDHNFLVQRLQQKSIQNDPQATYTVHYSFHNDKVDKLLKELDQLRLDNVSECQRVKALKRQEFSLEQELMVVKASEASLRLKLKKVDVAAAAEKENKMATKEAKKVHKERLTFPCKNLHANSTKNAPVNAVSSTAHKTALCSKDAK